jgi:anaerobic dimethyl sulfoxide reductase subunit B (iron-sulfur subunit)
MTQYGLYIDQNRCTGCFACVVACKDWHDVPAGPASWMTVKTLEKGTYPDLFVAFLPAACYHCKNPACMDACPVGAMNKRAEDGIVTVDRDLCLGKSACGQCLEACAYGAPQFGNDENAKMEKCDLCIDRWAEGKKPVCVMSCPMYALDAGPLEELWKKENLSRETEGFTYSERLEPCVVFKAKRNPSGS